ncbi:hypothetical protein ACIBQ1_20585 [Nonomuraea sp. NPDC050153]|uniref:hypothetical protein n=1 Tax=Nonomuraea sp. NPDC050153 TaxID=3364359 RepID=UPI0037A7D49B
MPVNLGFYRYPEFIEKTFVNADLALRVRQEGAVVLAFRAGRVVWWALVGLVAVEPYTAVLRAGPGALACVAALGLALGLLGCLAALVGGAVMVAGGVPFADLSWWTIPLLAGWALGALPWPTAKVRVARIYCILAPIAPIAVLWAHARSWPTALSTLLIMYVLLIRPHFGLVGITTAGVTRWHRGQIWLGAVIWLLGATLLALGPAGAWFVRVWPPGVLGFVLGTVCVAAAMLVLRFVYLLVGRGSLAKVTFIKAPAGMRLNRDRFSGLYGAELGLAWFCVTAAGAVHDDLGALIGSALALVLFSTSYAESRLEVPLRHTIDRLDAAHYLFSVRLRREQLRLAWSDDLGRALTVMARIRVARDHLGPGRPRKALQLDRMWNIHVNSALQLVEVITDESEKTALGDVDDTLLLPFERAEGRPPLLDIALKWADEGLSLLDLADRTYPWLLTAKEPLRSTYVAYRCYLHTVRGLANRLHGRHEESVMSYWTAARLYRDLGAVNAEAMALANILTTFPGVDPARPAARRTLPLAAADAAVLRATTDERVHPEVRREVAATAALMHASYGDLRTAEELVRRAAAIPPAEPGATTMGVERIVADADSISSSVGRHHLRLSRNPVDYGPLLRGEVTADRFLPEPSLSNPWILRELINGGVPVPGRRRLARGITGVAQADGFTVEIPDTMVIEEWIERTEKRGGFAMSAQFHELLGLMLRRLDPYPAAGHLVAALDHLQSVHFAIIDDELRGAARGAAERFAEVVIDHLATLATQPLPPGVEPEPGSLAAHVVRTVKSRALTELLGETVPAPGDSALMRREQEARARYQDARDAGDHDRLRQAREELEHCWGELIELGGPGAEYAALRAGLPIELERMPALLAQLASPGRPHPAGGSSAAG